MDNKDKHKMEKTIKQECSLEDFLRLISGKDIQVERVLSEFPPSYCKENKIRFIQIVYVYPDEDGKKVWGEINDIWEDELLKMTKLI